MCPPSPSLVPNLVSLAFADFGMLILPVVTSSVAWFTDGFEDIWNLLLFSKKRAIETHKLTLEANG